MFFFVVFSSIAFSFFFVDESSTRLILKIDESKSMNFDSKSEIMISVIVNEMLLSFRIFFLER